jgi:hypothetical protein
MRWKTYERLAAIDEALEERRLGLILGSAFWACERAKGKLSRD